MPSVNKTILVWARETAGLSIDQAAKALGLTDTRKDSAAEKLHNIESGTESPNRSLLLKMAKQYRRSLLVFYLSEPPAKGDRGRDFRSVRGDRSMTTDAYVDVLIRDLKARQQIVKTTLEDEETSVAFIATVDLQNGVGPTKSRIQEVLGIDIAEFRAKPSADEAFAWLREKVEAVGIFVILAGDLGSHHTAMPVEAFRGFALADTIAPFVVINSHDARTAWSFTLLHEVVHLFLGQTGISGTQATNEIEKFCNDVAAEILLPESDARAVGISKTATPEEILEVIMSLAREWNISSPMMAYRLQRAGVISLERWRLVDQQISRFWVAEKERQKAKARKAKSGPDYYVVKRHRVGNALLTFADSALEEGSITPVKAAKVLGVKLRAVSRLLAEIPQRSLRAGSSQ